MQDEWFEEEEALVSASITDEQLAVLSGTTDLNTATFLQMTVDSVSPAAPAAILGSSTEPPSHPRKEGKLAAACLACSSFHGWSISVRIPQAHVPLGTLGERMPKLLQLKLSGSALPSIRELGTSLRNLQVLWLCRFALRFPIYGISVPHGVALACTSPVLRPAVNPPSVKVGALRRHGSDPCALMHRCPRRAPPGAG